MGLAIISFVVVFLLLATGGMLLFYRDSMLQRINATTGAAARRDLSARQHFSFGDVVKPLEKVVPRSEAEVSVIQQRLVRAGFRGEGAVRTFYGFKVLIPALLCLIILGSGMGTSNSFFIYAAALGLGFLAPDFWLGRRITLRQKRIRMGLPDVLDLMVVCMEAGLSMDMATSRTAEELRTAQPAVSDELGMVILEQRAGRPRSDAWKGFADRCDVDSVRHLTSVLIQAEQLGTSIAKTLRIHADTLRTQRKQAVEEQAAKTTVKLVFPLVFCIFPSLFLVTLGPALIIMSESFHKYLTP